MATKGTRGTSIAFGEFEISVKMVKAKKSRDLVTEVVDEAGEKVSAGGGGSRSLAAGCERAVRLSPTQVVRLPQAELDAIVERSKAEWDAMRVLEVIDYRQVPTERIIGSYWLQPAGGQVRGLAVLAEALRVTGRVAVVKWCSNAREKLGVIRLRRQIGSRYALLLSEIAFANDFAQADEDATAITEVMGEVTDRERAAAASLLEAFARGAEHKIDTATDEAVDARRALFEQLRDEQVAQSFADSIAAVVEPEPIAEVVGIGERRAA